MAKGRNNKKAKGRNKKMAKDRKLFAVNDKSSVVKGTAVLHT